MHTVDASLVFWGSSEVCWTSGSQNGVYCGRWKIESNISFKRRRRGELKRPSGGGSSPTAGWYIHFLMNHRSRRLSLQSSIFLISSPLHTYVAFTVFMAVVFSHFLFFCCLHSLSEFKSDFTDNALRPHPQPRNVQLECHGAHSHMSNCNPSTEWLDPDDAMRMKQDSNLPCSDIKVTQTNTSYSKVL